MNDLSDFVKLLKKQRFLLLLIPLVSVLLTRYMVRDLPDEYASKASIATGIADQTENLLNSDESLQKSEIEQKFANMIQMMLLKKTINQVSYQLMIHDLTDPKPFRPASKLLSQLSAGAKKHALEVYQAKYANMTELSISDKDQKGLKEVLKSMRYDNESLLSKLVVTRANSSDFIDVKFECENAELCAFVANQHCKEFIEWHTSIIKKNQGRAINFLESLMQQKHDSLDKRMLELKEYKTQNHILNLNEQARALFGQIKDYETNKETAEKEIISYEAAIQEINNKFTPQDRKYLEATVTNINASIIETKTRLSLLNEEYVAHNFDESYRKGIDSLKALLTAQINTSTDKYIFNPLVAKQTLVTRKLDMEVSLDLVRNSVGSIESELTRLNKKFNGLVPHEAAIQANEIGIDVASKEYLEILNKYNQTTMASNSSASIRQVEEAMPGPAKASKKMMLVIVSGLASLVVCILVFFIMFYVDDTVRLPKHLAHQTKTSVLGFIPAIKTHIGSLHQSLGGVLSAELLRFQDLTRSIRFETELEMKGSKKLALTSTKPGEGKTFAAISLAHAYALTRKKVLLIDGNFSNPTLSTLFPGAYLLEDLLEDKMDLSLLPGHDHIQVLANKGSNISLFEICSREKIKLYFDRLENIFDIIIIDLPSLDAMNKVGEWIVVADKVVAVFEANKNINREQKVQVEYLRGLETRFSGWILNKVTPDGKKSKNKKFTFKKKKNNDQ